MNQQQVISLAIELEPFKKDLDRFVGKSIDRIHLDYLNKLSSVWYNLNIKQKPTFRAMFCFAYNRPTKAMMKVWLRNFK